ncbi:MAG: hypothetical protein NZ108_02355 [Bacteroidia bacterium]|nr:hypothetical protein [Bacteroidia bacterium]
MTEFVYQTPSADFFWIDATNPDNEEISTLTERFQIHETLIKDCLEPDHFPKYERSEHEIAFLIFRVFDEHSLPKADTVHELTRKIAIFICPNGIITVHRVEQEYLTRVKQKWKQFTGKTKKLKTKSYSDAILLDIAFAANLSYEAPLNQADLQLESYEQQLFSGIAIPKIIQELYTFKTRVHLIRKMLRMNLDVLLKIDVFHKEDRPYLTDIREKTERLGHLADTLIQQSVDVLNIYISLSSYQLNEIMRWLTVLSACLLPLTLITGIYGMNFQYMPELQHPFGYFGALIAMVAILTGILLFFRWKKWI